MLRPIFIVANLQDHREQLLSMNVEYVSWVFSQVDDYFQIRSTDVIGMSASEYVASVLDKVCDSKPPEGVFYLLEHQGQIAAMGGLRKLSSEVAEIKRIYVRPGCRGAKLGESMLARLMTDAEGFGYKRLRLESAPFMKAAHRIYEAAGFVDRSPYVEAEVPEAFHSRWRFMERPLPVRSEA